MAIVSEHIYWSGSWWMFDVCVAVSVFVNASVACVSESVCVGDAGDGFATANVNVNDHDGAFDCEKVIDVVSVCGFSSVCDVDDLKGGFSTDCGHDDGYMSDSIRQSWMSADASLCRADTGQALHLQPLSGPCQYGGEVNEKSGV